MKNIITVIQIDKYKAILRYKNLIAKAFIGLNGTTYNKLEGDKKTPLGLFNLGLCFGIHDKEKIKISNDLNYLKLSANYYWIDDINSKYYNKLVDIKKIKKDWYSDEHLIDYKTEYEYAIEIKSNPKNIINKGSAIFIHCSNKKPTSGCIAISQVSMKKLFSMINKNTRILIKNIYL